MKAFTRNRKLNFLKVFVLLLSKSQKSLQLWLNEFYTKYELDSVTASAFSQARAKFKHTAFIELNTGLSKIYYQDGDYKKHKSFRLLSIDGSKLYLPNEKDVSKEFGKIKVKNQTIESSYVGAQTTVLYDVLNEIVLDSQLAKAHSSEHVLAKKHLEFISEGDLVLLDRGLRSYELFSCIKQQKSEFLARCSVNAGKEVEIFLEQKLNDKIVTLKPHRELKKVGLEQSLRVRLVKVILDSGEVEILATSLLDSEAFSIKELKELYFKRWGVETYFGRIKSRLALEAFTGKTAESVKQDFFSTILVSNIETVYTEDTNNQLKDKCVKKGNKNEQKVNKAVAYNIIKNNILEIIFNNKISNSEMTQRMEKVFLATPTSVRKNRKVDRNFPPPRKVARFHKHRKKIVF